MQYSGNYYSVYEAERHIPSGLVAVLFCLMVFGNALSGRIFFGQTVTRRFLLCASGGVVGVVLIFWPEIAETGARPTAALGLGLGLLAVLAACIGNVLTLTLTRRGLPLVPILAWSMGYGAAFLLLMSLLSGQGLHFDWHAPYVLSLLLPGGVWLGHRLCSVFQAGAVARAGARRADRGGDPGDRPGDLGGAGGLGAQPALAGRHGFVPGQHLSGHATRALKGSCHSGTQGWPEPLDRDSSP